MSSPVTIGAYSNPLEAHLAKGRLEAEGIPASLAHEHHVWANWVYSRAPGGVKVQVPAEYAERAARVLDAHNRGGVCGNTGRGVPRRGHERLPALWLQ